MLKAIGRIEGWVLRLMVITRSVATDSQRCRGVLSYLSAAMVVTLQNHLLGLCKRQPRKW